MIIRILCEQVSNLMLLGVALSCVFATSYMSVFKADLTAVTKFHSVHCENVRFNSYTQELS